MALRSRPSAVVPEMEAIRPPLMVATGLLNLQMVAAAVPVLAAVWGAHQRSLLVAAGAEYRLLATQMALAVQHMQVAVAEGAQVVMTRPSLILALALEVRPNF